jgi:DNA-directed RNA polymerase subunit N (RpoN/RPB10)
MIHSKKSVHVNISKSAHAAFRIACFERGLSMQEVFEEFAQRVALESNDALGILDELKIIKESRDKSAKKYTNADVDDIYAMLESQDPLKEN